LETSQRALQRKMEATGCGRRVGFSFLALKAFVAAVSFSQLPFSFLFQELD